MPLVYAGVVSHAPGITGRAQMVEDTATRDALYAALSQQRRELEASQPDVLVVIAAEHFANFFMNNMPAFCMGLGDTHHGPIEDPAWLGIDKHEVPGSPVLAHRLAADMMHSVDLAYAEEWLCDHGIMVPLHFLTPAYDLPIIPININCQGPPLTPLSRAWCLGEALGKSIAQQPERIAIVGTGGLSHWPATPDSGKINEAWDREFLSRLENFDRPGMLAYNDTDTYLEGGQGGFEIRTYVAAAAAAQAPLEVQFYTAQLPIFAVGCTVGRFRLGL